MPRDHGHGHAGHDHTAGANQRSLQIAFGLTTVFLLVELVGGISPQGQAGHQVT